MIDFVLRHLRPKSRGFAYKNSSISIFRVDRDAASHDTARLIGKLACLCNDTFFTSSLKNAGSISTLSAGY